MPASESVWLPVPVDLSEQGDDEPMGTKDKFWIERESGRWLIKLCRVVDGRTLGEDWAEWLVHRIGTLLGVPTAVTEPALVQMGSGARRGIASRDIRAEPGLRLVHGNELLAEADPEYEPGARRENPRYTVAAVRHALSEVAAPAGLPEAVGDAFDAWAGYLALDALVAGRDRHHENWAVVRTVQTARLVPSFDHGNALGFQETEDAVVRMNGDPTALERWARRGRSHHFAGRPELVALADEALALASRDARDYWRGRIASLVLSDAEALVTSVPGELMSEARGRFMVALLDINRRRLTHGDP